MTHRFILTILCLVASLTGTLHAQTYREMWKEAYDLWRQKDLPQSAIAQSRAIYEKARAEQDTAQMLRAELFGMYQRGLLSTDSFYVDLPKLEKWATNPALSTGHSAVMHSVLGGIYQQAMDRGKWSNSIMAPRPEDVSTWTRLMYAERAFEHYLASIRHLEELQSYDAREVCAFVYNGKWSDYYDYSLMHVIGRRAIFGLRDLIYPLSNFYTQTEWEQFPLEYTDFIGQDSLLTASAYDCTPYIMQTFRRMLRVLEHPLHTDAWLLMELNRLNIKSVSGERLISKRKVLEAMKEEFAANDLCAEIHWALANDWLSQDNKLQAIRELKTGIDRYPRYSLINMLKNKLAELRLPKLETRIHASSFFPGQQTNLQIRHVNLDRCTVWIYRMTAPADSIEQHTGDREWLMKHARFHSEARFALKRDSAYQQRDTTLILTLPQEKGVWLLETLAEGKSSTQVHLFDITALTVIRQTLPDGQTEFVVLDSESGHPVPHATLYVKEEDVAGKGDDDILRLETDDHGQAVIKLSDVRNIAFRAVAGEDSSMRYRRCWQPVRRSPSTDKDSHNIHLVTDRTIYRPGQTVYVKGVVFRHSPMNDFSVTADARCTLLLQDPKGNTVDSLQMQTNSYGSVSGEFTLPASGLNGNFTLKARCGEAEGRCYVNVQEYKRPTFEVQFDSVPEAYAIGDTVTLTGTARTYAGVPVAYGKVSYHIAQDYTYCLRGQTENDGYRYSESGETVTDEAGRFSIRVPLVHKGDPSAWYWWSVSYRVEATVTSQAGESRQNATVLRLSSCPLRLSIPSVNDRKLLKKAVSIRFEVENLDNVPMQTTVHWQLFRNWEEGGLACQGEAVSNTDLTMPEWAALPSGCYRLRAATALPGGADSVQYDAYLTLYDHHESKVPAGLTEWWQWTADEFGPDSPTHLQFGTTKEDVYVLMDVFTEQQRIDCRRFILSDTVQTFTFDYLPHYGLGITVELTFVREGKTFRHTRTIRRKEPEKKLQLRWSTFRDKLAPGGQEEWAFTVCHADGRPADAEVVARMYDASLDALPGSALLNTMNSTFWLLLNRPQTRHSGWGTHYRHGGMVRLTIPFDYLRKEIPRLWRYADFADIYTQIGGKHLVISNIENVVVEESTVTQANGLVRNRQAAFTGRIAGLGENEDTYRMYKAESSDNGGQTAATSLRTDFSETAFFQPHLRTDSTGAVRVVFTLPESLTRWHVYAFAHTPTMDYGTLEGYATAQKQFMVQPNLPRFVRTGDEVTVQATISNLSARRLKGNARLELTDPATGRTLLTRKAKFRVEANATGVVTFQFRTEGIGTPLPACRITAEADGFSDGEQRYLPILSDREWVTEALPLTLTGADTLTHTLTHLFNHHSRTATGHRLTVEFTGNPAWTALQALPAVATPTDEDAYSWAVAWYARRIATHIADSSPHIKAVFDQWQSSGADSETLQSRLEKNQELKTLVLEETPWMADAANEEEQHRRLALLFDSLTAQNFHTLCTDKLRDLQSASGGWSWRKGMPESRTMTTAIVELMHRTTLLTGQEPSSEIATMLERAEHYLDQCLRKEYDRMRKAEQRDSQKVQPSETALHYLYARTVGGRLLAGQDTIVRYLIEHLPVTPTPLTPYGKACAAIILHGYGQPDKAMTYLRSLREYQVRHPQQGSYFDHQPPYYGWRNADIATQVAAIEAIIRLQPEETSLVEEMKQWLLTRKQVRQWSNPIHTADATYALLMRGTDLLAEGQPATLLMDGQPVRPVEKASTVGTDYLKRTYSETELASHLPHTLTVQKADDRLAWGAVYAQYLEKTDRLTASAPRLATDTASLYLQPLTIERQLLVERLREGVSVWEPVTDETTLHKGDLIISRLIIKADRAMDFVQLKESRPACAEPLTTASGYRFSQGLGYYLSVKDASTLYFFDRLPKGTHTLDSRMRIDRPGRYQAGPATIQCAYAPEFNAHTESKMIESDF